MISGIKINKYLSSTARLAIALALVVFTTSPVLAQEQNVSAISAAIGRLGMVLPGVYVDELEITQDSDQHITGSFVLLNSEAAAIGDITYATQILSPPPPETVDELVQDSPLVFDTILAKETYALNPDERRPVSFELDLPALPAGEYRLRIQIVTSNDRELGWGDSMFTVTTSSPFISVATKDVNVDSYDPIDPEKTVKSIWAPLSGVNVDSGEEAVFTATVQNHSTQAQTVVPVLTRKRILTSNADTEVIRGRAVTFQPGVTTSFETSVTADEIPGAHRYLLTFETLSGKKISAIGEYRLVVRGASASIVAVRLTQFSREEGSSEIVDFAAVGPSDRETEVQGAIRIALEDDKGTVAETNSEITLNLGTVEGTATLRPTRTIQGVPTVTMVITDEKGEVLDEYAASFADITEVKKRFSVLQWLAVILVISAGALVAGIRIYRKKA